MGTALEKMDAVAKCSVCPKGKRVVGLHGEEGNVRKMRTYSFREEG